MFKKDSFMHIHFLKEYTFLNKIRNIYQTYLIMHTFAKS